MSSTQSESSRHPLSTSSAKAPQDRPLPDIYGDDPDRHAAQDKKVLETLIYHQYPLDPVSPMPVGLLIPVIIEVVLLAKQEDPHIPLRSEFSDVRTAVKDEEFRKVIETCYRSGFYKDLRNHRMLSPNIIINESNHFGCQRSCERSKFVVCISSRSIFLTQLTIDYLSLVLDDY